MVQLRINDSITAVNVIDTLKANLDTISTAIQPQGALTLEPVLADRLTYQLDEILKLAKDLSDKNKSDEVKKLLRHFIFLLDKYGDRLVSSKSVVDSAKLHKKIAIISDTIGFTPRLNAHITLPHSDFLPVKINSSKERWKKIPCERPSRTASTIETGKIGFLERGGVNSVRASLKTQLKGQKLAAIQSGTKEYYLNLVDQEYYQVGLLDADHLLASSNVIARQQEMIEMMNYDPEFRQEMINSRFNDEYFILTKNPPTLVVGSYWFYQSHHNAMQNLWFLLSADNSGGGKVAMDPVVWLKSQEIGVEYLGNLSRQGKKVDKDGVFYLIHPDGQSLKDSFIQWAEEDNHRLIKLCNLFAHFHHEIRADTKRIIESGTRHRSAPEVSLTLQMTKKRALIRDPDEHSLSSGGTGEQEEIVLGAIEILDNDEDYQKLRKQLSAKENNAIEQSKKKVAYEAGTRPSGKPF